MNTPLSHVVSELKIGGPVYSQTGDTSCWSTALRTAALWLANDDVEHVIVAGGEEFDPVFLDVMHSARWFGSRPEAGVSEGAGAVLLGKKSSQALAHITRIVDGFAFRNRAQAAMAAESLLAEFDPVIPVADTAANWTRRLAAKPLSGRMLSNCCGVPKFEAFTATCAWNTIRAVHSAEPRLVVPFLGLSQQMGAIEIFR